MDDALAERRRQPPHGDDDDDEKEWTPLLLHNNSNNKLDKSPTLSTSYTNDSDAVVAVAAAVGGTTGNGHAGANGNHTRELSPLLGDKKKRAAAASSEDGYGDGDDGTLRYRVYQFLEARTPRGLLYERFMIILILTNVAGFVLGTLFVPEYNPAPYAATRCGKLCDALWFGNDDDNDIAFLGLGATSVLEIFTVAVFTVDYVLRVWTADEESPKYRGFIGRIRYIPTFFSLVDLASTVPFYVDVLLVNKNLAASQFLRMFRLFRMMRVEGRYDTALTMFDDVFYEQRSILGTALFVGVTTWVAVSSLYYLAERRSTAAIYCGAAPPDACAGDTDEVDTSLCTIDSWGFVDCTAAGCIPTDGVVEPCYNLYRSIGSASYYSLLNLFGEFPLIDQHSPFGKVVGTVTAVVAVAVFALPVGIIGNGFEELLDRKRREEEDSGEDALRDEEKQLASQVDELEQVETFRADPGTVRGRAYNFFHARDTLIAEAFDHLLNLFVLVTTLTFFLGTVEIADKPPILPFISDVLEDVAVCLFTIDYVAKLWSIGENPTYGGWTGAARYAVQFLPLVDLLSVAPFWLGLAFRSRNAQAVKALRVLRVLRFERYTHAFTSFRDVIGANADVLAVTGFTALVLLVFFSAILYFTERDNPDQEVRSNYITVPHAMWMTLLNLTGECPLCHYSTWGKVVTGIIGIFATGLFGIPIGILGAGFEELVVEEVDDTPDADAGVDATPTDVVGAPRGGDGDSFVTRTYKFVNGIGSKWALYFEISIYVLILATVFIGIIQTVSGWEDVFHRVEWFAVIVFTVEYVLRIIGAPADPDLGSATGRGPLGSRIRFVFSFYSIVDLLAIVPMYLAYLMPGGWFDQHDEYLRMLRLLRLLKLDKYVPSITLIDDVIRLKKNLLIVTGFAAGTLWIIFSSFLYLAEHDDMANAIDPVPVYGCDEDCTMADRFRNAFDSLIYTGIHLTGDYPITTYALCARFLCFFMVIAAVGVVSVPSGLIASGFADIVQTRTKSSGGGKEDKQNVAHEDCAAPGDDWYEFQLRELKRSRHGPPPSRFGPVVDSLQLNVQEFLNGRIDPDSGTLTRTTWSVFGRCFIFLLIIGNVFAVLLESVPEIDRAVGNEPGNAFDVFEAVSVIVFAVEYGLRLFSARKNVEALYSPWVYATTFYGIVDLLSIAPWFVEQFLLATGHLIEGSDSAKIFRIFRIFRILQLEDFIVAFQKLDNVFRASKDVLKATGLMALIIWVGCGALFFIFEQGNPNWRECDDSIPLRGSGSLEFPGCYDFASLSDCNAFYGQGSCTQTAFVNMPDSLYYVAVFLGGEWGLVDFTWPGRLVCMFMCVAGIALYAIPTGTLFDSFGVVLGMAEEDDDEEDE